MAILSDSDRQLVARDWVRKIFVELANTANMSHTNIKAAVDAADQWADDNATAFNNALPVPFRTTATTAQKTLLLSYVILKRAGII
jgi:hypothetical protein